jgi:hypothetical protein
VKENLPLVNGEEEEFYGKASAEAHWQTYSQYTNWQTATQYHPGVL